MIRPVRPDDAPDAWDHRATGSPEEDGLVFRLSFQPLAGEPWGAFHGYFHEALQRLAARSRAPCVFAAPSEGR